MHKKSGAYLCILPICGKNLKKHLEIGTEKVYHIYSEIYLKGILYYETQCFS